MQNSYSAYFRTHYFRIIFFPWLEFKAQVKKKQMSYCGFPEWNKKKGMTSSALQGRMDGILPRSIKNRSRRKIYITNNFWKLWKQILEDQLQWGLELKGILSLQKGLKRRRLFSFLVFNFPLHFSGILEQFSRDIQRMEESSFLLFLSVVCLVYWYLLFML